MINDYMRVYDKDFNDLTIYNHDDGATVDITLADDTEYFHIAKRYPFNTLNFWIDTPDAGGATMKVEYYDGTTWINMVDLIDYTKGMTADGIIQFTPSKYYGWKQVYESEKEDELNSVNVYNMYWLRIGFSAGTTFSLKNIAYALTDKQAIEAIDKDLDSYLTCFNDTDFLTRTILDASNETVLDLRVKGIVANAGSILNIGDFYRPVAYKALELIYFNLGDDYLEQREIVMKKYNGLLNKNNIIDQNQNAIVDKQETTLNIKRLVR